jgi:hypothetical protein
MLSKPTQEIYEYIVSKSMDMVRKHVMKDDLTWRIDYASIYANSIEEFEKFSRELKENGTVALPRSTGDYYILKEPLHTSTGIIRHCRVRTNNEGYKERGYVDFESMNHEEFVKKYSTKDGFRMMPGSEVPMVELFDSTYDVRAYFPENL